MIALNDDAAMMDLLKAVWQAADGSEASLKDVVTTVLGCYKNWKMDLNTVDGLNEAVTSHLVNIEKYGMAKAIGLIGEKAAVA
jgi:hypothetical protein